MTVETDDKHAPLQEQSFDSGSSRRTLCRSLPLLRRVLSENTDQQAQGTSQRVLYEIPA